MKRTFDDRTKERRGRQEKRAAEEEGEANEIEQRHDNGGEGDVSACVTSAAGWVAPRSVEDRSSASAGLLLPSERRPSTA